jgi:hypothetical protein
MMEINLKAIVDNKKNYPNAESRNPKLQVNHNRAKTSIYDSFKNIKK